MTYDPQNFESVLLYMRQEFGTGIFREPVRMYSMICDLSPGLKAYGNVMRQLSERGALTELEGAARNDDLQRNRAMMKARHILETELLLDANRAGYLMGALGALYGFTPPQATQTPPPNPALTETAIVKRGACGDHVTFALDKNGLLTISGAGPMRDFEMNEQTHICNTPWWDERGNIARVEIQRGVTSVGEAAFVGCVGLRSVSIPDSVTVIGSGAFVFCGMKGLTIPNSVMRIGTSAFYHCSRLKDLTIPGSVKTIGALVFDSCAELTSVTMLDGVKTIENGVFRDCKALTNVTIPDSVTKIGHFAFEGCDILTSVSVPANADILPFAFPDNISVTRRGNPQTLKSGRCGSHVAYTLDNHAVLTISGYGPMRDFEIDEQTHSCDTPWWNERSAFRHVEIQDGVTTVAENAFVGHDTLTSVTISKSVKIIKDAAFAGCKRLTDVTISDGVTTIKNLAFFHCDALKYITIPDSVTTIEAYAFGECDSLTSVSVPANADIEPDAFPANIRVTRRGGVTRPQSSTPQPVRKAQPAPTPAKIIKRGECGVNVSYTLDNHGVLTISGKGSIRDYKYDFETKASDAPWWNAHDAIAHIEIRDGVTKIGNDAFHQCENATSVTIPDSVTEIGNSAFFACRELENVRIPNSVKRIGEHAFADCMSLTSIVIPKGLKEIENNAFAYCKGATSLTIPDSVTRIDYFAFYACMSLESVIIPDSVKEIEGDAFFACKALKSVTISNNVTKIRNSVFEECEALTSVTIPDGVTVIEKEAFKKCKALTNVTIPNSVTKIGADAFADCDSLKSVSVPAKTKIVSGLFSSKKAFPDSVRVTRR